MNSNDKKVLKPDISIILFMAKDSLNLYFHCIFFCNKCLILRVWFIHPENSPEKNTLEIFIRRILNAENYP
jgi:hypothetical protein